MSRKGKTGSAGSNQTPRELKCQPSGSAGALLSANFPFSSHCKNAASVRSPQVPRGLGVGKSPGLCQLRGDFSAIGHGTVVNFSPALLREPHRFYIILFCFILYFSLPVFSPAFWSRVLVLVESGFKLHRVTSVHWVGSPVSVLNGGM